MTRAPIEDETAKMLRACAERVDLSKNEIHAAIGMGRVRLIRRRVGGVVCAAAASGAAIVLGMQTIGGPNSGETVAVAPPPPRSSTSVPAEGGLVRSAEAVREAIASTAAQHGVTIDGVAANLEERELLVFVETASNSGTDDLVAAILEATKAVPDVPAVNVLIDVSLTEELDELAARIFASRDDWSSDPDEVFWTYGESDTVTVSVGVSRLAIASALPRTQQLPSGATAAIVPQVAGPVEPESG